MMSLSSIKSLNRERAEIAAAENMTPFVYSDVAEVRANRGGGSLFPFPFIGDHRPEGWELVESHFADSSGFGRDDEHALSANQLLDLVESRVAEHGESVGWAIIEAGQFQVFVGEFHR